MTHTHRTLFAAAVAVAALCLLAAADPLPPGPYQHGCTGCAVRDGVLRCDSCRDGFGTVLCTEHALDACTSFMNNDGTLECTRSLLDNAPDSGALPAGPYLAECGGCALYPSTNDDGSNKRMELECTECPDRRGVFHIARLVLDGAAPCAEVLNADGRLFCRTAYHTGLEHATPRDAAVDNNAEAGAAPDVAAVEAELQRRLAERVVGNEKEATCM